MASLSMSGQGKYIIFQLASINKFPSLRSSMSVIIKHYVMILSALVKTLVTN